MPHLSPLLASGGAVERLQVAAGQLPHTGAGGFECHLGNPDRVDLGLRFRHDDGAAWLLQAPWPSVRAMAERWLQDDSAARGHMRYLFLEFDLPPGELTAAALPAPGVFFGTGNPPDGAPACSVTDLPVWAELVAALQGYPVDPAVARLLVGCRRQLPLKAWMGFLGLMLGRNARVLRATVSGLPAERLAGYLTAVDWRGDLAPLAELASAAARLPVRLTLHLDIGTGLGPDLGVELAPAFGESWEKVLPALAAAGIMDPQYVTPLLDWQGMDEQPQSGLNAPLGRALNHLKVGWNGTGRPAVKAYLYCGLLRSLQEPDSSLDIERSE